MTSTCIVPQKFCFEWCVIHKDENGYVYTSVFAGLNAKLRALQYADWKYGEYAVYEDGEKAPSQWKQKLRLVKS